MYQTSKRIITFSIIGFSIVSVLFLLFLFYVFVGQEYVYAKKYANTLLQYEVPEKTRVVEEEFNYGISYGGGPWGSGGYPTVVAFQKIRTELSEKEVYEHYDAEDFEIYFEGTETIKKDFKNQIWYEGKQKSEAKLDTKRNDGEPIEVIIQYRTEFTYPLFIDLS